MMAKLWPEPATWPQLMAAPDGWFQAETSGPVTVLTASGTRVSPPAGAAPAPVGGAEAGSSGAGRAGQQRRSAPPGRGRGWAGHGPDGSSDRRGLRVGFDRRRAWFYLSARRGGDLKAVVDTDHERPDHIGWRRYTPAPHHPYERQAARTSGKQAHPVLRDRAHGRGRHHRHRHRGGRHPGRDHGRGGGRLGLGCPRHLPPPGRAPRPGPLRADRPGVPGRRRLRHVPGRQHAPTGPGRVHRALRPPPSRTRPSRPWPAPTRPRWPRSCCARSPIRTASGWPRSTRWATWCGWSRSPRCRRRIWPWWGSTCSPRPSTKRSTPSSRRRGASSRSPTPSSG